MMRLVLPVNSVPTNNKKHLKQVVIFAVQHPLSVTGLYIYIYILSKYNLLASPKLSPYHECPLVVVARNVSEGATKLFLSTRVSEM